MKRRQFLSGMAAILAAGVAPAYIVHAMPVRPLGTTGLVEPDYGASLTASWEQMKGTLWGYKDGKWSRVLTLADWQLQDRIYHHRGGLRVTVKDRMLVMPSEEAALRRRLMDHTTVADRS